MSNFPKFQKLIQDREIRESLDPDSKEYLLFMEEQLKDKIKECYNSEERLIQKNEELNEQINNLPELKKKLERQYEIGKKAMAEQEVVFSRLKEELTLVRQKIKEKT